MNELIICPLCGFSFRNSNSSKEKQKIKCPMCGYEFKNPRISPFTAKEFDRKI
ncbi:MAG: hypothetical protein ACFFA4_10420 [Promethearchaeota archaeon]